jgi:hypothetical protein
MGVAEKIKKASLGQKPKAPDGGFNTLKFIKLLRNRKFVRTRGSVQLEKLVPITKWLKP